MQGVPEQFNDERDSARFSFSGSSPSVELYHAHISRYTFEPHTHVGLRIGAIEARRRAFSLSRQRPACRASSLHHYHEP